MGEEFQAGVCGSTSWWSSPISSLGLSPCSAAISTDHMGSFGWASHELVDMNMKARSGTTTTDESAGSVSDGQPDSGGGVLMDSTLQMMGIGLSSPSSTATTDWNQALVLGGGGGGGGGRGNNYQSSNSILQEDMINSRLKFRQETRMDCSEIGKEWSTVNNNISASERQGILYINQAKQRNRGFPMDETRLSSNCTTTSQALPSASFPMSLSSYGYPSNLLQTLFDDDTESVDPQPVLDNRSVNYSSATNYHTNMNGFSPSMAQSSPLIRPSQPYPKQQHNTTGSLQQTNSKPLWNTSTAALNDHSRGTTYFPSMQAQFLESTFEEKPSCPSLKRKAINEVAEDSKKSSSSEPAFKRQRVETPSLLPTFKVRKEKLGDRITALQQLVSPFGKTDTASVLQEAIEYIKFLHDQVLRTPYMNMKNGALIQNQQHCHKLKDSEGPKQDLRSRGLCLVPVSSTYPVASETTADFWTPAFGGTAFR